MEEDYKIPSFVPWDVPNFKSGKYWRVEVWLIIIFCTGSPELIANLWILYFWHKSRTAFSNWRLLVGLQLLFSKILGLPANSEYSGCKLKQKATKGASRNHKTESCLLKLSHFLTAPEVFPRSSAVGNGDCLEFNSQRGCFLLRYLVAGTVSCAMSHNTQLWFVGGGWLLLEAICTVIGYCGMKGSPAFSLFLLCAYLNLPQDVPALLIYLTMLLFAWPSCFM